MTINETVTMILAGATTRAARIAVAEVMLDDALKAHARAARALRRSNGFPEREAAAKADDAVYAARAVLHVVKTQG